MTVAEAREFLTGEFQRSQDHFATNPNRVVSTRVTLTTIQMVWVNKRGTRQELKLRLAELGKFHCGWQTAAVLTLACRSDNSSYGNWNIHWVGKKEYGPKVVAAISALQTEAEHYLSPEGEARFQSALQQFHAQGYKPQTVSTEANQLLDEAQAAVKVKDLLGAAELYLQAGERDPLWPASHFNAALVLGELGDLDLAIREMNRYLALAPDATNARVAQQQVYEWKHHLDASK